MKKYRIPYQEEIRVWQNCTAIIETDDTPEEIYKHIQTGDFISHYDCELTADDIMYETEEIITYDFDNTDIDCIEEID